MRSRRRIVRVAIASGLAVLAVLGPSAPASAGAGDGEGNVFITAGNGPSGPEVFVTGVEGTTSVIGAEMPAWLRQCTWRTFTRIDIDATYAQYTGASPRSADEYLAAGESPDEEWAAVLCNPGSGAIGVNPGVILTGILDAWPLGTQPPQIILDWIIARSYAAVEIPVPAAQTAPFGDDAAPMIAQLATWGWIEADVWQPVSATPAPVFGVTATATATPYDLVFQGSDGQVVNCGANGGPAYDFTRSDDNQSSDCTLTFEHSSAVADHEVRATIRWSVAYVCSQYCGSGTLPDYVITSVRSVRVAELQAIATSIGNGT